MSPAFAPLTRRFVAALAVLALFGAGCAGVIEPRLPGEFKGKKLKEDPPLTLALPLGELCA